jgi:hypothetical protein
MPKKPAITPLEIVPKEVLTRVSTDKSVSNSNTFDVAHIAEAIKADIDRFERTTKEAAFCALRIGLSLMYIRDSGAYGALTKFIKTHFGKAHSERTLFRYIAIAEAFAKDTGLVEKKTHKLTNGQAIAPILETQLELFTDPAAQFDGAMKKLMAWVGERGLSDLYKAQKKAAPKADDDDDGPPKPKTADELAQEAEEEMNTFATLMDGWFLAAHHTRINKDQRTILDAAFEAARTKLKSVK